MDTAIVFPPAAPDPEVPFDDCSDWVHPKEARAATAAASAEIR